eukprot:5904879-Amphidinium_carterae.1
MCWAPWLQLGRKRQVQLLCSLPVQGVPGARSLLVPDRGNTLAKTPHLAVLLALPNFLPIHW